MPFRRQFLSRLLRRTRAAPDRPRPYRPVLECLEDRSLLSGGYAQVNLASDVPGLARVTDPNLINPWGIAFSTTGPFWIAENGAGVSDVLDGRGQLVPLVAAIPAAGPAGGSPAGVVFSGGDGFSISEKGTSAPARFLFASEDGTISAWSEVVDPAHALPVVDDSSTGAGYKGLAVDRDGAGRSYLYAANFRQDKIDVFDGTFAPVSRPGDFQDPGLPAGYAPFNIQNINGLLFVAYAEQDGDRYDDVSGVGHGFIDIYDADGSLVRRFASGGALDSPWGLALAPARFGPFSGDLLVGNRGDGRINAYDPASGAFLGQLADGSGAPVTIPGLWALSFGNNHVGGAANALFFTAGTDGDQHGLFGAIRSLRVGDFGDTAGPLPFDPDAPGEADDYPLPPSGGPAFRSSSADRVIPISDLLPSSESSLTLVPTLSTISQLGTRIKGPVPAGPIVGVSFLPPGMGVVNDAVALGAFIDLNAFPNAPQKETAWQRPGSNPPAAGARSSDGADRDAGVELSVTRLEAQTSEEQGPEEPPPSSQADERLAGIPSQSRPESADERAATHEREPQDGGGWTKRMNRLAVVGFHLLLAYWLTHRTNSRHPENTS